MKKLLLLTILMLLIVACGSPQTAEIVDAPAVEEPAIEEPTVKVPTATAVPPTPTSIPATATALPPRLQDFSIELIVMEKKCFGSAGFTITVRPDLTFSSLRYPYDRVEVPPGKTYTLIYEIYGGEDGTETYNLTIHGDTYTFDEERISTAHKNDELTVEAVRLIEDL